MKQIICKSCFFRWRFKRKDYCKLIETEHGGNIYANREKCDHYLKKGTEPKWLCSVCGENTYGDRSTSENGKHYCDDCWWKKEGREYKKKQALKLKKIAEITGSRKKAKEIMKLF